MKPLFFSLLLLLSSCTQLLPISDKPTGEVTIALNIAPSMFSSVESRSGGKISDLDIIIFDQNGSVLNSRSISSYTGTVEHFVLPTSTFQLAVIANSNNAYANISNLEELKEVVVNSPTEIMRYFSSEQEVLPPDNASGVVTLDTIRLQRCCAKVTVVINTDNLDNNITLETKSISLRQGAKTCVLLGGNTPISTTQIIDNQETITSNLNPTRHKNATPLYPLENLQGTIENPTTTQADKIPPDSKKELCTYIEVEAQYTTSQGTRPIKYRFYLGENETTDFNLVRNHWYKVTLNITGNGGIDENSWRVDLGDMEYPEVSFPVDLFLPGEGYRSYSISYNKSINWHMDSYTPYGTTAKTNKYNCYISLGNDYNKAVRDYLIYVKADNTESRFYRLGTNFTQITPDLTRLFFPHNSTFGFNNYPITQYINFPSTGDDFREFSALSTAKWLYIGDGETYKAFSGTGEVNTTAITTNMHSSKRGRLNLESIASEFLAVRCEPNTTSEPRSAYIFFYHKNEPNMVYALITVHQNPATYPSSPYHLSYIPGGVYKPGGFTSYGDLDWNYPNGVSTVEFYAKQDGFYVSTTEVTNLQFCDFLNDIGATSTSDLIGANGILDKSGVNSLNYAGNTSSTQVNSFSNTMGTTVEYKNGGWIPQSQIIAMRNGIPSNNKIMLSNFPMEYLSFFTAADYNYWAMKYSGKRVDRSNESILITELEWEAAARGINNKATTINNFNSQNGLYPFPVISQGVVSVSSTTHGFSADLIRYIWHAGQSLPGTVYGGSTDKYSVGMLMPNSLGLHDMSGGVSEWCFDLWQGDDYPYPEGSFVDNGVYIDAGCSSNQRVYRGGDSNSCAATVGVASRYKGEDMACDLRVGIRGIIR